MDVFCINSVNIALNALEILMPSVNSVDIDYIVYIAMLLYIVYGILFVDTVDVKIKACHALNAML